MGPKGLPFCTKQKCTVLEAHHISALKFVGDSYYAKFFFKNVWLEFPMQQICISSDWLTWGQGFSCDDELDLASIVPAIIRSDMRRGLAGL